MQNEDSIENENELTTIDDEVVDLDKNIIEDDTNTEDTETNDNNTEDDFDYEKYVKEVEESIKKNHDNNDLQNETQDSLTNTNNIISDEKIDDIDNTDNNENTKDIIKSNDNIEIEKDNLTDINNEEDKQTDVTQIDDSLNKDDEVGDILNQTIKEDKKISTQSETLLGDDETVTLKYDLNGNAESGKGSTNATILYQDKYVSSKEVVIGKEFGKFDNKYIIDRKGYKLIGYSFKRDGEVIKETDIVKKEDIPEEKTLYAIWEPLKYKLKITRNILMDEKEIDINTDEYIEFTFDENIIETINKYKLRPITKEDNEKYECLEFLGWSFNENYHKIIKETDNFVDVTLNMLRANDPTLCAVYEIKYTHVKLNAAEGFYDGDKKVLDIGLVPAGIKLVEADTYREPTPPKDMRLERWWVSNLTTDKPMELDYEHLKVGMKLNILDFDVDELSHIWNVECTAHYEEDRYPVDMWSGGTFKVFVRDRYSKWSEWGEWNDPIEKYQYVTRLNEEKNWLEDKHRRTLWVLKGKNLKEAMDEIGFELPTCWDRDLIGWQAGFDTHPDRVDQKYVDFKPVEFSNITVEGPMAFTAVWWMKPIILTFKEGENATFASGRTEYSVKFPARDIYDPQIGVIPENYEGSLYDDTEDVEKGGMGYEDPQVPNENYMFVRWEEDKEFISEKKLLRASYYDHEDNLVGYDDIRKRYTFFENVIISGNYKPDGVVFIPFVDKIQIPVRMYSPFPIFGPTKEKKNDFTVGSGLTLGEVDEFINTDFTEVEEKGYHFAGWYIIDHEKVAKYGQQMDLDVHNIEFLMEKGMPTVSGVSKPGLDTWFKYVQSTVTDDIYYALGQYLTKIDGDFVLNKKSVNKKNGELDILAIFTSNLTLDAGEGTFANEETKKTIKGILPMIENQAIKTYTAAGYEVPIPKDKDKIFAGWRLNDINGRMFSEYEAIEKDTYLVASYIKKEDQVTLTIDLHGAEMVNEKGEIVEMPPMEIKVAQGTPITEVELPKVTKKGYKYYDFQGNLQPWYYDRKYESPVYSDLVLKNDITIHLKWKEINYSYAFVYDTSTTGSDGYYVLGTFGQKIKDTGIYKSSTDIRNIFDPTIENQPEKGYRIKEIRKYNETGQIVTKDTEIDGNVICKLIIEPLDTTITFDANGGELNGNETVTVPFATKYNQIATVPQATKEGHFFVGWEDSDKNKITEDYIIKEKENTFTAIWTDATMDITLDAIEGEFTNGKKIITFNDIPLGQTLANVANGNIKYEEPTLKGKVFERWEISLTKQREITWTKTTEVGDGIFDLEAELKAGIVLRAIYKDKTISFSVKLRDPSAITSAISFTKAPEIEDPILPKDYILKSIGTNSGGVWIETVKEGSMTFAQWFDHMYEQGYRYRPEYGHLLLGWKYDEQATADGPRRQTKDMVDVDMNAIIKDGDVFVPLMAKGTFTVQIDANGGTYDEIEDRILDNNIKAHRLLSDSMVYRNVPAGHRADWIDPTVIPKREGYTFVGYSRFEDTSGKSLANNPFVSGNEYFYAVWSDNNNQFVQPTVNQRANYRPTSDNNSTSAPTNVIQNANEPRIGTVQGLGPQAALPADAPKQFTQNISEDVKKQTEAQVTQMLANIGVSSDVANSSQVQQAAAEIQVGMNIKEQYDRIANLIKENPSITEKTTRVSNATITDRDAYWHTDENGNVTLESFSVYNSDFSRFVVDAWQPIKNAQGETGWYKFDEKGYMQTGLVQDGPYTYYLSEEKGAGYGQMICNQTINIGGLTMTFNANGALVDMQYNPLQANLTLQNAIATSLQQTAVVDNSFIGPQMPSQQVAGPGEQIANQQVAQNQSVVGPQGPVQQVVEFGPLQGPQIPSQQVSQTSLVVPNI